MLNSKNIAVFVLSLLFIILPGQISCRNSTTPETLNHALAAMNQVTFYQLDTLVTWNYTGINGSAPGESIVTWTGDRSVNVKDNALYKSMTIDKIGIFGDKEHWTLETYYISDYVYEKVNSDSGKSNTFNVWFKSKTLENGWLWENQIAKLLGLMKTSTDSTPAGTERLNGIDCYFFNIQPSNAAIADWVVTQFQGYGAADLSTAPFLGGKNNYLKYFKNGTFKVWIAKDSYLVMKAVINPQFEATPQDLGVTSQTEEYDGFDKVTSEFQGQMIFSNYNHLISIQPPPEALDAIER